MLFKYVGVHLIYTLKILLTIRCTDPFTSCNIYHKIIIEIICNYNWLHTGSSAYPASQLTNISASDQRQVKIKETYLPKKCKSNCSQIQEIKFLYFWFQQIMEKLCSKTERSLCLKHSPYVCVDCDEFMSEYCLIFCKNVDDECRVFSEQLLLFFHTSKAAGLMIGLQAFLPMRVSSNSSKLSSSALTQQDVHSHALSLGRTYSSMIFWIIATLIKCADREN